MVQFGNLICFQALPSHIRLRCLHWCWYMANVYYSLDGVAILFVILFPIWWMCNSNFADKQMAYQCQLIYSIFYPRASWYIGSIAIYILLHCPFCVFSISDSGHEFRTIVYLWHFLTDFVCLRSWCRGWPVYLGMVILWLACITRTHVPQPIHLAWDGTKLHQEKMFFYIDDSLFILHYNCYYSCYSAIYFYRYCLPCTTYYTSYYRMHTSI